MITLTTKQKVLINKEIYLFLIETLEPLIGITSSKGRDLFIYHDFYTARH